MDPDTHIATPNSFNVDGDEIVCICDAAHLIKNIKSCFMSSQTDFVLADDVVQSNGLPSNMPKFGHILDLAKFQVSSVNFHNILKVTSRLVDIFTATSL